MIQLYLCEKPSQARDIAQVLGATVRTSGTLSSATVTVTWCFGHLLEMAQPEDYGAQFKRWTLESLPIVPEQWQLHARKSASKQLAVIQSCLKRCQEVVIATDADREGEVIAREILDRYQYRGRVRRLWLSALDDQSIRRAMQNLLPDEQTKRLYDAGLSRARADWLVGINLTRAYTVLGRQTGAKSVLSVGRVQTPTLHLVVERDRQIENFVSIPYWAVLATLKTAAGAEYIAHWVPSDTIDTDHHGHCISEADAAAVAANIENQQAVVNNIESTLKKTCQPLSYDLSTLQADASAKYGLSAQKTLQLAQSLYEHHKLISYPRTPCGYLPESQFAEAGKILAGIGAKLTLGLSALVYGADAALKSRAWNQQKVATASHHGIMPLENHAAILSLSDDEEKLYTLICRRYIAQFYPLYRCRLTVVTLSCCDETWLAKGKEILAKGWQHVYANEHGEHATGDNEQLIPRFQEGELLPIIASRLQRKQTKPPPRYTEGTLIQAMKHVAKSIEDKDLRQILRETSGLGQEATRAGIIDTLKVRKYIKVTTKKHLVSTDIGRQLIDAVPSAAKDPLTTALWEQSLDDIAEGNISMDSFLHQQSQWVAAIINQLNNSKALEK